MVFVHGQKIFDLTERARTHWHREQVGFVIQSFGLLPTLSVYENVESILRMSGVNQKEHRQRSHEALGLVGLID